MRIPKYLTIALLGVLIAFTAVSQAQAQGDIRVETDPVECLPIDENGVAFATVENNIPDTTVRLYFRRMHDSVEDLYWVAMKPEGQGRYWSVMPKAEDRPVQRHELEEQRQNIQEEVSWAKWWREKDASDHRNPTSDLDDDLIRERASQGKKIERDWLGEMDDQAFQDWLEQLENEPAEYYASVHDYTGAQVARSRTRVTEVKDSCRVDLTPQQAGEAENLTVGETAYWQRDEGVFHWLCDGIVSRIDPTNVIRGDSICRACVVAWWKRKEILIPAAAGVGVITGITLIDSDDPAPVSPSNP